MIMQVLAPLDQGASGLSDRRRELTALVAGCGVYRPQRALFALTGRDRVRWLNGMVTNNIRDLAPAQGVYSFVLNAQGHILGDLYVFNRGESLVAEIEREQAEHLLQVLKRYIIMDKVEIEDLNEKIGVIGVAGPKSGEVLAKAGLNADLSNLQIAEASWNEFPITLIRGDNPCVPNYEIWVPTEKVEFVIGALLKAGAESVGDETLETFRILCGIPKVGHDIHERTLPQETGQERALNFIKGCYIGQEIIERIRARGSVHRTFTGFEVEGVAPAAGTKIQSEGKDVGEITSVMTEPLRHKRLALGFLRKEYLEKELVADGSKVRPTALPFFGLF
jgi:folate-binding protein YgfZ